MFPAYYVALSLGIPRTTAILLLAFQVVRLRRYVDFWNFIDLYLTKHHVGTNSALMEISKLMILLLIFLQTFACILIYLGNLEGENR